MSNLSHYEYRFNEGKKWLKVKKDSIKWRALGKINTLSVRGINRLGRAGPITFIKLRYE